MTILDDGRGDEGGDKGEDGEDEFETIGDDNDDGAHTIMIARS
jgi:hypothetical protein